MKKQHNQIKRQWYLHALEQRPDGKAHTSQLGVPNQVRLVVHGAHRPKRQPHPGAVRQQHTSLTEQHTSNEVQKRCVTHFKYRAVFRSVTAQLLTVTGSSDRTPARETEYLSFGGSCGGQRPCLKHKQKKTRRRANQKRKGKSVRLQLRYSNQLNPMVDQVLRHKFYYKILLYKL